VFGPARFALTLEGFDVATVEKANAFLGFQGRETTTALPQPD
jgi:hypothetical protein